MEVEGLLIHGAAHLFFEHKLEDLTAEFNGKIKKMEAFIKRELYKLHDLHMGKVKKIKSEVEIPFGCCSTSRPSSGCDAEGGGEGRGAGCQEDEEGGDASEGD